MTEADEAPQDVSPEVYDALDAAQELLSSEEENVPDTPEEDAEGELQEAEELDTESEDESEEENSEEDEPEEDEDEEEDPDKDRVVALIKEFDEDPVKIAKTLLNIRELHGKQTNELGELRKLKPEYEKIKQTMTNAEAVFNHNPELQKLWKRTVNELKAAQGLPVELDEDEIKEKLKGLSDDKGLDPEKLMKAYKLLKEQDPDFNALKSERERLLAEQKEKQKTEVVQSFVNKFSTEFMDEKGDITDQEFYDEFATRYQKLEEKGADITLEMLEEQRILALAKLGRTISKKPTRSSKKSRASIKRKPARSSIPRAPKKSKEVIGGISEDDILDALNRI